MALAVLGAALIAAPASARVYRAGSFKIKAPGGWKLKTTGKGGYVLSCASAKVGFKRIKAKKKAKKANLVGNALVKQMGLVALQSNGNKKRFKATVAGTRGSAIRQGGIAIRRKGRVQNVRAWAADSGTSGQCAGRAVRGQRGVAKQSALIDELAGIANSAAGGRIRDIRIKQISFLANPPIPLRRYEVCSNQPPAGTPNCSSALVPESWFPNIQAQPGFMQGIGAPGIPFRGQFTLGGVGFVYQNTCFNPFGNPGYPERQFTGDPADAVVNVWPQTQAFAAATASPLFTAISNVQILAVLRAPWIQGAPSGLFLVRWNQDGRVWSSLFGAAIINNSPDACYWAWYFSYVAAPDNGVPGTATALFQTWASWRLSYEPITQRAARSSGSAPNFGTPRARATASAGGDTESPSAAGIFATRNEKQKMPDLRDIAP